MQDISGTSLAASVAAGNPAVFKLEVKWGNGDWVDETSRVESLDVDIQATDPDAGVAAVGATFADEVIATVDNDDGRFNPWNPGGALYSYIADGAWDGTPARLSMGYRTGAGLAELVWVQWGPLAKLVPNPGRQTAELRMLDKLHRFTNYTVKTILYENISLSDYFEVLRSALPANIRPTVPDSGIDQSLFSVPFAWADDDPVRAELDWIAQAEGGRIYCTPSGRLMFESGCHLVMPPHDEPVATYTVDDFAGMTADWNWRDKTRRIEVWYSQPRVLRTQPVWQAQSQYLLPAGETTYIRAEFDGPARRVQQPAADEDYYASSHAGRDKTDAINVTATIWAQQALVAVENPTDQELVLQKAHLRGQPIHFGDEELVGLTIDANGAVKRDDIDTVATGLAGRAPLVIKGNWYIQTPEHALALGLYVAYRIRVPRAMLWLTDLDSHPWMEVGDRVLVTERNGVEAGEYFVQAIRHHVRQTANMELGLLAADGMFASSDYFRLGVDALDAGKVYYL